MKKCLLIILFYITTIHPVKAQQAPAAPATGRVSGKVTDADNKQPVEFATVVLFKKDTNQPAQSIQTDLQGNFKLTNIAYGTYLLRITFVGYANLVKDSVIIGPLHKNYMFNTLKMHAGKNSMLSEVTVKSKKSSIQLGIDRKVFSVDQSLVSEGGSATDLLANVPSVQVDVDGNINLRGSSNVRVLVDGKPSLLAGGNVSDILQSIPANSIETIELITNPSSKYDPEGQSGIINIVLKKNKSLGFNGSASVSAGNYNAFNSNVALAYQHKKINLYGNYSHRQNDRSGGGFSDRSKEIVPLPGDTTTPYRYNQTSTQTGNVKADQIKAGIDYDLADKTKLGFSTDINIRNSERDQNSTTNAFNSLLTPIQLLMANSQSHNKGNNHDFNLDFSQKFKKPKEELTASLSLAKGNENDIENLENSQVNFYGLNASSDTHQYNVNTGNLRNWNIQADYTDPIGKDGKLELGYRTTLNRSENNFVADTLNTSNQFVFDPTISTDFIYDEKTNAVYGDYQQQFGKFGVQAGARFEKTVINTDLVNFNEAHVQNYFRFYPSVFLTDKLSETGTLQLSYSRRINRPRDRSIIPFLDRSDPLNYRTGNPDLKPEDVHSFELSYAKYWGSTTLTSSLYYRRTNDIVQSIRSPYGTTGITLTDFYNFSYGTTEGFEFIARTDITPKWNITSNINIYQGFIKGGTVSGLVAGAGNQAIIVADNSSFAYNGNITTNLPLPFKLSAQLRGDYQAPQAIAQGRTRANAGLDAALKHDLFKHKASLSLNGRDILNTRKYGYVTNDGIYHNDVQRRFQSRMFLLTLAYHFGANDFKGDKDKKDKQQDNNNTPDDMGQ